jgi:outer membrane protein
MKKSIEYGAKCGKRGYVRAFSPPGSAKRRAILSTFLFLFFLLFAGENAFAQADAFTLSACLEYALKNNPFLTETRLNAQLSAVQRAQTDWAFAPSVGFTSVQGYNLGRAIDPTTNQFADVQTPFQQLNLTVTAPLWQGLANWFARAQAARNRNAADAADADRRLTIQKNVIIQYWTIIIAEKQLDVQKSQLEATKAQLARTRAHIEAGAQSAVEETGLRVQLAAEERKRAELENQANVAYAGLREAMGLPAGETFRLAPPEWNDFDAPAPEISIENLPGPQAAFQTYQGAITGVRLQKAKFWPAINAFAAFRSNFSGAAREVMGYQANGYEQAGYAGAERTPVYLPTYTPLLQNIPYGRQFTENFNQTIGFSFEWRILDGKTARFNHSRAKLEAEAAQARYLQTLRLTEKTVTETQSQFAAARERLLYAKEGLAAARAQFEAQNERFNLGAAGLLEYLNAKNNYAQAEAEVVTARCYGLIFGGLLESLK